MMMFKGKNIFRDGACLVALIALVQYNVKKQFIKHASTKTIVRYIARQSLTTCTNSALKAWSKLNKIAQKTKDNLLKGISTNKTL